MEREEIFAEVAEKLAEMNPVMVNDPADIKGSARTVLVDQARIDGVEGIIHVVAKQGKFYAKFISDDEYKARFANRWSV